MEIDLSRVIDLLPGLVWTALPDGRADFVNKRWCEYTGLSFDEACGVGWVAALHPDDASKVLENWQSLIAAGEPGELETRLRRADGVFHRFLFHFAPIADTAGSVAGWCGICTDVEEQRRAEEAPLKWAETLLSGEKRLLEMVAQGASRPPFSKRSAAWWRTPRQAVFAACSRSIPTACGSGMARVRACQPRTTRCSTDW